MLSTLTPPAAAARIGVLAGLAGGVTIDTYLIITMLAGHPRRAMVPGAHGIEQVGSHAGARLDAAAGLGVGCIAVAQGATRP